MTIPVVRGLWWLFALWICVLVSSSSVQDISVGSKITTYNLTIEYYVFYMQEDELIPGNLLISDGCSLKTLGTNSEVITGKATHLGYLEGAKDKALFGYIPSFYQFPSSVIIVDYENHCLRRVERQGSYFTKPFVGQCQFPGYSDERWEKERFSHPHGLIDDPRPGHGLIVTDWGNSALRLIHLNTDVPTTSTLIQNANLNGPRALISDRFSNSLFINTDFKVFRYSFDSNSLVSLAGADTFGFQDGSFSDTMFHYPRGIVQLNKWTLAVTDGFNYRVRVLDMFTNTTSSICSGTKGQTDGGNLKLCQLNDPQSLHIRKGALLVGELRSIREIDGSSYIPPTKPPTTTQTTTPTTTVTTPTTTIPSTSPTTTTTTQATTTTEAPCKSLGISTGLNVGQKEKEIKIGDRVTLVLPAGSFQYRQLGRGSKECVVDIQIHADKTTTTSTTTTPTPPTTTSARTCQSENKTVSLSTGQETAIVRIGPDTLLKLGAGLHFYQTTDSQNRSCTITIHVLYYGQSASNPSCPSDDEIKVVTSNVTELGMVDLSAADSYEKQSLSLPVGIYPYNISSLSGRSCFSNIRVMDWRIVRKVSLSATYNVKCSAMSNELSKKALTGIANNNYRQIEEICDKDCSKPAGSEASLACSNDVLTITWRTDLEFPADVTEIPPAILQRLTRRLVAKGSILSVFVFSGTPGVVFPTKLANGAYADIHMTPYCREGLIYSEPTDSCV